MFAGLMGLETRSNSALHRCEATGGGKALATAGSSGRRRHHRRPGYMRGEQCRLLSSAHAQEEEEEEEEITTCFRNGNCGCSTNVSDASPAAKVPLMVNKPICSRSEGDHPTSGTSNHLSSEPHDELSLSLRPALQPAADDSFKSSFSFIQQSLSSSQRIDSSTAPLQEPEPLKSPTKAPEGPQNKHDTFSVQQNFSKLSLPVHSSPPSTCHAQKEDLPLGGRLWRESRCLGKEETSHLLDCESRSLDVEVTSSLSVDSDTASASSFTSGYESATPGSEPGWDSVVKKYEGVLQACLQNNRAHTKIESMMLKLQRLQQKAILDDDYDAAERFRKKLEELCSERGALELGLPSRQPSVSVFLERLRQVVHGALQRTDCGQSREEPKVGEESDPQQSSMQRRDRLIQEKRQVEGEMAELQQKLEELKDRRRCLEQQIQQEEQQAEDEELQGCVLRSCTLPQLRDMSRTLQDLVTSENRTQISLSTPASTLRLQEQEEALNLSIKEATAKVVMSQRLGSSLRRKVSETETQLLALHEAKLAAISGNDFSGAKELKEAMKAVYVERDRLEALAKRLHSLSSGSSQELARMKEQRQQLKQELEQREAQHEERLKENTSKYMELLEDRLHSCGCSGLERIWEADLEACHLFLRGLQLRTSSCSGADVEDVPAEVYSPTNACSKEEEEDCAMLTALGGRWCPEADLQNSEFTKKLEEFLFCMEENHPEQEVCLAVEAADLTDHCELISDRLVVLEDELQTALLNRDQALTQSLEKEVQEVKSTLQSMLAQLKVEEEEEGDENESEDLLENVTEKEEEEEEEEEEDQYFSDSWDI
ncbi:Disrupted in schizophrenia 1 protein [Oryzias melastigma]|uniref:Disrupted in schizophrenia 1 protein n=1 Tax=Oryzias melastigma TaxID=30732 RepID=A0A834CDE8_ORYME|nr:Disrupted in schizophrenia 1 protein [Oryzias melastigma]